MTQEEKAKAYDSIFERLKEMYNNNKANVAARLIYEKYFPELRESKDEKIRKLLLESFKSLSNACTKNNCYRDDITYKDVIAWLEKQGEHSNFLSKIQIGDKVTRNEDGVLVNLSQLNRVAKKQGEQKSAKFDDTNAKRMFIKALECVEEQNAKGYKLTDCDKNSWWEDFKAFCSEQNLANSAKTCKDEQDAAWSEKYIADVFEKVGLAKIVREQSNDALTNAIQDAMIELSKFIPQPKQEWSEEDEKVLHAIRNALNYEKPRNYLKSRDFEFTDILDWLKSLKERYTWKPSDEQMIAIQDAMNIVGVLTITGSKINSLYQDLKKLI